MSARVAGETLLCDTSFVSVMQAAGRLQDVIQSWPEHTRRRLDSALLAISVVSIAELRAGHLYAEWGTPRRQRAEILISAYLQIPLDVPTLDHWARLAAHCKKRGRATPHNDLWIAAAALSRGWPLVSCDRHFDEIPDLDHIYLVPRRA